MSHKNGIGRFGVLGASATIACITSCSGGGDEPGSVSQNAGKQASLPAAARSLPTATAQALTPAVAQLRASIPSARVRVQNDRIRRVYGRVATGKTPALAAEAFRRASAPALGVDFDDLKPATLRGAVKAKRPGGADGIGLMRDPATGKYKFRLFTYRQERAGIPVFRSGLRVLVREGTDNPVVWANADVRPLGSFVPKVGAQPRPIDLDKSLQALQTSSVLARQRLAPPKALTPSGSSTLTIFAGVEDKAEAPRLAMQYTARDPNGPGKWTFVADAETGDILHVESHLHFNIDGTVQAEVITGPESMECGTLGIAPLPYATVTSPVGNAVTDATGAFTIVESGSGAVTLESSMTGEYFTVNTAEGSPASQSLTVTPPGPASFLHQDPETPPELVLAQLNAYKQVNELRDLLLAHVPEYPVIAEETDFPVYVNRSDILCVPTGGAWYDDDSAIRSINFCRSTAERANAAFGSIVHHEYGHHIIDSGGSGQAEYGEGMADTIAMLFSKDPRIGVGYYPNQCGQPLRHADRDCQYSPTQCSTCGSALYECGAVLSRAVWDLWQALEVSEPEDADAIVRSLVFSSIPLHTGTGIDETIALDLLTLDDDDGLVENGTPHYAEICGAFEGRGMSCPPIATGLVVKGDDLDAEGPTGGPFEPASISYTLHNVGPEPTLSYSVSIPSGAPWLSVDNTGGTIALGSSVTVTVSIDQAEAALLADGDYSATLDFVSESGTVSREAELRVGAPEPIYVAPFDDGIEGFVVDDEPGNLWHHSLACLDTLPGHSAPGSLYYGKTEPICDYTTPTPIRHTITSPEIVIPNPAMAELGFNYYLETESDWNYDRAEVLISVADGPFQLVASSYGEATPLPQTREWRPVRLELADLLPATGPTSIRVQLAFNAVDPNSNTNPGFGVDDITVYAKVTRCGSDADCDDGNVCNGAERCIDTVCGPGTPMTCDDGDACTDDACDETLGCVYEDNGTCSADGAFIEVNGTVVMEGESFGSNTPRSAHRWDRVTNLQASGQAVMVANPNVNQHIDTGYATTSPELTYPVQFTTPGTYFVWVRGRGTTADDDSLHVGIDGAAVATADRITGFGGALGWSRNTMDGPSATIQVTEPGLHTINVWMREDGFSFDKLVLTTNASFWPSGAGPAESARVGAGTDPCAAFCSNPVVFSTNNYQSGDLGTGASCHATTVSLNGGVCGNLVASRKLFVNGVEMPCTWAPWPSLPAPVNGGYCIHTTAGDYAWAAFATW